MIRCLILLSALLALVGCSSAYNNAEAINATVSSTSSSSSSTTTLGAVSTLAGSTTSGSSDGTGAAASFYGPQGVATDGTYVYVADTGNNTIRKIVISTGTVTTLAGSTTSGSTDGSGTAASFNTPSALAIVGSNLYVADTGNNLIRRVNTTTGSVTTFAGSTSSGSSDGTGTGARFNAPYGITTDGTNLYVADTVNNKVREIVVSTGVVTTLAGSTASGSADGTGSAAQFYNPFALATDGTNVYVADSYNNKIRAIVISSGVVTTLAGSGSMGSSNGTGTAATLNNPQGIATDGTNVYFSDTENYTVRKIVVATGVVSTLAGSAGNRGFVNATGTAAEFGYPSQLALTSTSPSRLFVADDTNNAIREIQ